MSDGYYDDWEDVAEYVSATLKEKPNESATQPDYDQMAAAIINLNEAGWWRRRSRHQKGGLNDLLPRSDVLLRAMRQSGMLPLRYAGNRGPCQAH